MYGVRVTLTDQSPATSLVFQTLLTHGPLTRAEAGRRTGLSAGAVTKATAPLLADGWITELGRPAQGQATGRPATLIAVRPQRAHFIGIKVTADEVIGVLANLTAEPLATRRRVLPSQEVGSVVHVMSRLVQQLHKESAERHDVDVHSIGVALSGDVDSRTGIVHYSPFLGWRRVPLAQVLQEATGLQTVIENDVRALTVAEQWFGAGAGLSSFALITVGAGIGCGLSIAGRVITGAHGVSGEIGHLPVGDPTRVCTCGNTGCVEAVASTDAITEQARQASGNSRLTIDEAVTMAHAGAPEVRAVFSRAGHALGLAIASVANLFGPERIIISGEGVASYDLFAAQIRDTFASRVFGAAGECDVIVRPLPFEEWARGGAAFAAQQLFAPTPRRP
jgi:predicted NBD/HSP70 family sugar kinase